ncbi:hypothetical protein DMENIID0001_102480 [Sergentomyia squamirostris]
MDVFDNSGTNLAAYLLSKKNCNKPKKLFSEQDDSDNIPFKLPKKPKVPQAENRGIQQNMTISSGNSSGFMPTASSTPYPKPSFPRRVSTMVEKDLHPTENSKRNSERIIQNHQLNTTVPNGITSPKVSLAPQVQDAEVSMRKTPQKTSSSGSSTSSHKQPRRIVSECYINLGVTPIVVMSPKNSIVTKGNSPEIANDANEEGSVPISSGEKNNNKSVQSSRRKRASNEKHHSESDKSQKIVLTDDEDEDDRVLTNKSAEDELHVVNFSRSHRTRSNIIKSVRDTHMMEISADNMAQEKSQKKTQKTNTSVVTIPQDSPGSSNDSFNSVSTYESENEDPIPPLIPQNDNEKSPDPNDQRNSRKDKERSLAPIDQRNSRYDKERSLAPIDQLNSHHDKVSSPDPTDQLNFRHDKERSLAAIHQLNSRHDKERSPDPTDQLNFHHDKERSPDPNDQRNSRHDKERSLAPIDQRNSRHDKVSNPDLTDQLTALREIPHNDENTSGFVDGTYQNSRSVTNKNGKHPSVIAKVPENISKNVTQSNRSAMNATINNSVFKLPLTRMSRRIKSGKRSQLESPVRSVIEIEKSLKAKEPRSAGISTRRLYSTSRSDESLLPENSESHPTTVHQVVDEGINEIVVDNEIITPCFESIVKEKPMEKEKHQVRKRYQKKKAQDIPPEILSPEPSSAEEVPLRRSKRQKFFPKALCGPLWHKDKNMPQLVVTSYNENIPLKERLQAKDTEDIPDIHDGYSMIYSKRTKLKKSESKKNGSRPRKKKLEEENQEYHESDPKRKKRTQRPPRTVTTGEDEQMEIEPCPSSGSNADPATMTPDERFDQLRDKMDTVRVFNSGNII